MIKRGDRVKNKSRLASLVVLSAVLVCSSSQILANEDFSYISFTDPKPITLINPRLYVNTQPTEKPVIHTKTPQPLTTLERKGVNFVGVNEDSKKEETPISELELINDFFAPPQENSQLESQPQNNLHQENLPKEDLPPTYDVIIDKETSLGLSEEMKTEELDLTGYTIGNIEFVGLKNVNPDLILANIKTECGSLFNQELLQQDLQAIYALGFFTDKMEIEPELREDNTVNLRFVLQENVYVNEVQIMGNSTIPAAELYQFVEPLKGLPQNVLKINKSIEEINNYYHSKGYILAQVDTVTDDEEGILTLGINEGVINKISFEGNKKTKDFVLQRNILTTAGMVYNEEYLKNDITRLYSTNIFDEVDRNIYPSPDVEGAYDVKIVVKEGAPNSLSLEGGIDNALGGFGGITYRENNFLGRGQKLSLSGILGSGVLLSDSSIKNRMNYQLELNFFEPYFLNADNSLRGKLFYRELGSYNVPLAIERRVGLMGGVEHKVKGYNNLSTEFMAGVEHIHLKEGDFNKISNLYNLRRLDIRERSKELSGGTFINLAPGVRFNTLDTEINPRNGIIAQAKFMEAIGIEDFKQTNGRIMGSVSKYFPVGEKSSFSLTAKGGIKVHGDEMPEVMAFRLGGPYTIRGFKMNGVGTGDSFIMGSAELATPVPFVDRLKWDFIKTLRITFFVDAGKVYDPTIASVLYDRPLGAISAGVGLRIYIPNVGPISVDYGIPLTNPGDYGSKNGYFTFGTGVNGGYYGW